MKKRKSHNFKYNQRKLILILKFKRKSSKKKEKKKMKTMKMMKKIWKII